MSQNRRKKRIPSGSEDEGNDADKIARSLSTPDVAAAAPAAADDTPIHNTLDVRRLRRQIEADNAREAETKAELDALEHARDALIREQERDLAFRDASRDALVGPSKRGPEGKGGAKPRPRKMLAQLAGPDTPLITHIPQDPFYVTPAPAQLPGPTPPEVLALPAPAPAVAPVEPIVSVQVPEPRPLGPTVFRRPPPQVPRRPRSERTMGPEEIERILGPVPPLPPLTDQLARDIQESLEWNALYLDDARLGTRNLAREYQDTNTQEINDTFRHMGSEDRAEPNEIFPLGLPLVLVHDAAEAMLPRLANMSERLAQRLAAGEREDQAIKQVYLEKGWHFRDGVWEPPTEAEAAKRDAAPAPAPRVEPVDTTMTQAPLVETDEQRIQRWATNNYISPADQAQAEQFFAALPLPPPLPPRLYRNAPPVPPRPPGYNLRRPTRRPPPIPGQNAQAAAQPNRPPPVRNAAAPEAAPAGRARNPTLRDIRAMRRAQGATNTSTPLTHSLRITNFLPKLFRYSPAALHRR